MRPESELAAKIASLPYDVMDTEEARAKIAADPFSFLTVTKSEATLPEGTDPYSDEVYAKARVMKSTQRPGKIWSAMLPAAK